MNPGLGTCSNTRQRQRHSFISVHQHRTEALLCLSPAGNLTTLWLTLGWKVTLAGLPPTVAVMPTPLQALHGKGMEPWVRPRPRAPCVY